jgi:pimeloyl-ACP methyl ester carboxylesterase
MGANIAADLIVTHPDRFLSATLGGAAGRQFWTEEDLARSDQAAAEWEQGKPGPALFATALAIAPTDEPKPSPDSVRMLQQATLRNPNFDRLAQAAVMRSFRAQGSPLAQVAAVTVPTLGIAGSVDPNLTRLETLKGLRPALKLVVIPGASHSGPRGALRRPEFVAAVREFLATTRAPNRAERTQP